MTTERLGTVRKVQLTPGVVLEVSAVYPDENEDAAPIAYHVIVWNQVSNTTCSLEQVKNLLAAFGGIGNLW